MQEQQLTGYPPESLVEQVEAELKAAPPSEARQPLVDELAQIETGGRIEEIKAELKSLQAQQEQFRDRKLADDPVIPNPERYQGIDWSNWKALVAEPPFVPPPADDPRYAQDPQMMHRLWNYWMMSQRVGAISYLTFSAGFSLIVYVLFYIFCDLQGLQLGLFRTLGTNALIGYILHDFIGTAVKAFVPRDAPWWFALSGFFLIFYLVYLFIRTLEKQKIYIRL
jgi:hypothetical protein